MKNKIVAVITLYRSAFQWFKDHNDFEKNTVFIWVYDSKSCFGYTFDEIVYEDGWESLSESVIDTCLARKRKKKKNKKDWSLIFIILNLLFLLFLFILIYLTINYGILSMKNITTINHIIGIDLFILLGQIVIRKNGRKTRKL